MESDKKQQRHFVLVHGFCHGAWCWYRVATILRSAGHRVTALDLAACGASPVRVDEVRSFAEHVRPLIDAVAAVPTGEKVVLVGHSYGGYSLALAMQTCPDKIAVAVFVSAAMPVAGSPMSLLLKQDLTLATMLVRPARWFVDDALMKEIILTEEKFGVVSRVYVVTEEDGVWSAETQRRMASRIPGVEVMTIEGADHMPMFSKPQELSELLMEIANKYN